MTDETFAALERRLLLAQAGPGVPPGSRGDVLDLLAECRRLRQPPDAAGILTAAERAGMLRRAERDLPQSGYAGGQCLRLLRHAEAQDALVRELYGVIADLHADDPGRQALQERGRAEGREEAARAVDGHHSEWPYHETTRAVASEIRALGPCRPPLPPSEAERDAGRLREALRAVVAARDGYDEYQVSLNGVYGAIDAARAALGEGP